MSIQTEYSKDEISKALASSSREVQAIVNVLISNESDLTDGYCYYASFSRDGDDELVQVISTLSEIAKEIIKSLQAEWALL